MLKVIKEYIKNIKQNEPRICKEGWSSLQIYDTVYGRILGECFVNGESLSSYLVREGFAFAYRKYSNKYIQDEEYAKFNNLGMWSMEFEYPWDYRSNN